MAGGRSGRGRVSEPEAPETELSFTVEIESDSEVPDGEGPTTSVLYAVSYACNQMHLLADSLISAARRHKTYKHTHHFGRFGLEHKSAFKWGLHFAHLLKSYYLIQESDSLSTLIL